MKTDRIEQLIESYLPKEEGFAAVLARTMNYSMRAGGKRLRPLFLLETCRLFDGDLSFAEPFAVAIEMIHTHSLIHDDLPALDNDDFRRGRPTVHRVFGEAMGVLGGVTLLNYAYETMFRVFDRCSGDRRVSDALRIMANKTGIHGMLGGQSVDVENDGKPIDKELLDYIYKHKTSALIEASMMTGAVLAGADKKKILQIETIAKKIGLAFQIQDDILDVTSTSDELGKPVGSDEKNNKVTYVTLFGTEQASRKAEELSRQAILLLDSFEQKNEFLRCLIEKLIGRRK